MGKVLKVILVNLLILLILILGLELILRGSGHRPFPGGPTPEINVEPGGKYYQKDSLLGYIHIPGAYQITLKKNYQFQVTHDSSGRRTTHPFSSVLIPKKKRPEIWLFGCSLTYGFSVNDEETFAWRLQHQLPEYEIVNFGANGYSTLQFRIQLENALRTKEKPHLVIINHADFHHERNSLSYNYRSAMAGLNFLGEMHRPFASLSDENRLLVTYSGAEYFPWKIAHYSALAYMLERKYETWLDGRQHNNNLKITSLIFDEILNLSRDSEIRLLITNIDLEPDFAASYCSENNIPFVDISVNRQLDQYNNFPYDKHPSAAAHQLYAERLFRFISENGLLPD